MKILYFVFFLSFFLPSQIMAQEVSDWLKKEIDIILDAYKNEDISNTDRFDYIENTINKNFAGAGIAKFVAGQAWGDCIHKRQLGIVNLMQKTNTEVYINPSLIDTKSFKQM